MPFHWFLIKQNTCISTLYRIFTIRIYHSRMATWLLRFSMFSSGLFYLLRSESNFPEVFTKTRNALKRAKTTQNHTLFFKTWLKPATKKISKNTMVFPVRCNLATKLKRASISMEMAQ